MVKKSFGYTKDGKQTELYIFRTGRFELAVSDYGSTLVNLVVLGPDMVSVDVVLGYDSVSGYEEDAGSYLGCNVGRNANRIANASFTLNGIAYQLDKNDGENNLHSGFSPYSKRIWNVEKQTDTLITFSLESSHMDQGFPGNLKLFVTYEILSEDSFRILYEAESDEDTVINLTNHSYFNLNGEGAGGIEDHHLTMYADCFTPTGAGSIPTGEICTVEGTPMDFRKGKRVGKDIGADYDQLILAGGYDHNWVTRTDDKVHDIVKVQGDISGITMKIATDYPGVQMYTGNYLDGIKGKKGHIYTKRTGICFEPQFYPDAINKPEFISPVCRAGEKYRKEIVYSFFSSM